MYLVRKSKIMLIMGEVFEILQLNIILKEHNACDIADIHFRISDFPD